MVDAQRLLLSASGNLATKVTFTRRSHPVHTVLVNSWRSVEEKAEVEASTETGSCVPYLVVGHGDDFHALVTVPSGFLSPLGTKRIGETNGRAVNYENKTSALWFGI